MREIASWLVRDAQLASDLDTLLRVWRDAVEATHAFLSPSDVAYYETAVKRYLPEMPVLRVAVDDDDRPVGFIGMHGNSIEMLFVSPALHGRGVGSLLLEDVGRKHETLYVDVNEQNPSGRAFYERRGFRKIGYSPHDAEGRPFPILHLSRTP